MIIVYFKGINYEGKPILWEFSPETSVPSTCKCIYKLYTEEKGQADIDKNSVNQMLIKYKHNIEIKNGFATIKNLDNFSKNYPMINIVDKRGSLTRSQSYNSKYSPIPFLGKNLNDEKSFSSANLQENISSKEGMNKALNHLDLSSTNTELLDKKDKNINPPVNIIRKSLQPKEPPFNIKSICNSQHGSTTCYSTLFMNHMRVLENAIKETERGILTEHQMATLTNMVQSAPTIYLNKQIIDLLESFFDKYLSKVFTNCKFTEDNASKLISFMLRSIMNLFDKSPYKIPNKGQDFKSSMENVPDPHIKKYIEDFIEREKSIWLKVLLLPFKYFTNDEISADEITSDKDVQEKLKTLRENIPQQQVAELKKIYNRLFKETSFLYDFEMKFRFASMMEQTSRKEFKTLIEKLEGILNTNKVIMTKHYIDLAAELRQQTYVTLTSIIENHLSMKKVPEQFLKEHAKEIAEKTQQFLRKSLSNSPDSSSTSALCENYKALYILETFAKNISEQLKELETLAQNLNKQIQKNDDDKNTKPIPKESKSKFFGFFNWKDHKGHSEKKLNNENKTNNEKKININLPEKLCELILKEILAEKQHKSSQEKLSKEESSQTSDTTPNTSQSKIGLN